MKTEYNGPDMTPRKLTVLLLTAAVIVTLFVLRTCSTGRTEDTQENSVGQQYVSISEFDSIMIACQDSLFDWMLLSAIAYVESRFDSASCSNKGATGLMQIMPSTYREILLELGLDSLTGHSPGLDVRVAVRYMHHLADKYSFINEKERLNYILGSYNGGSNHIFDAMRIARRDGVNRYSWESLTPVLRSLSDPQVYGDTLCQYGAFDATETLLYVQKVQKQYEKYRFMNLLFLVSEKIVENSNAADR